MLGASQTESEEPRDVEQKPNTVHKAGVADNLHPDRCEAATLPCKLCKGKNQQDHLANTPGLCVSVHTNLLFHLQSPTWARSTNGPQVTFVR